MKREIWRKLHFFKYIKEGPILEIGYGSGEVLKALVDVFPSVQLFGIDVDKRMQHLTNLKRIPRCTLYVSPAEDRIDLPLECRTVIFCASIHEILSFSGLDKVKKSLENAYSYLADGGRVIIWDGIKPDQIYVTVSPDSPRLGRFIRFVQRFSYTAFNMEQIGKNTYRVPFQAVAEFVSKIGKLAIPLEYRETHFPLTESQYIDVLEFTGFRVVVFEKYPLHKSEIRYAKAKLGIIEDINKIPVYGLIVGEK